MLVTFHISRNNRSMLSQIVDFAGPRRPRNAILPTGFYNLYRLSARLASIRVKMVLSYSIIENRPYTAYLLRKPYGTRETFRCETCLYRNLLLFQKGKTCAALKARPTMPGELPPRHTCNAKELLSLLLAHSKAL